MRLFRFICSELNIFLKKILFVRNIELILQREALLQVINFIESTLHDIFVYKAVAFTYFFLT